MKCTSCENEMCHFKSFECYNVYKCHNCRHYQMADESNHNYDYMMGQNDDGYLSILTDLRARNFSKLIDSLRKFVTSGGQGLDVGYGAGVFLKKATEAGYLMTGIDPNKRNQQFVQQNSVSIINGYFPDALPSGIKFDFIVFNDAFEHIPNSNLVALACREHLKENGYILINLPVNTGIYYRLSLALLKLRRLKMFTRLWQTNTYTPHLFYYSKKSLTILMDNHGFKLLESGNLKSVYISIYKNYRRIHFYEESGVIPSFIIAVFASVTALISALLPKDTKYFIFKKIYD